MRFPSPAHHRTVAEFRAHLQSLDRAFDCVDEVPEHPALAQPVAIGTRRVGNRFATHPMEGWDGTADGLPSEHTLRRWRRFGRSGAKLIWGGEAFAVQADGRANPRQLYLNPRVDVRRGLEQLRAELLAGHREIGESIDDLYIGLQLTHSGRFSRPSGAFEPKTAAHHPGLERKYPVSAIEPMTDAELEAIGDNYVAAATAARDAGFDFVDVKCCHGYLLHELLGAKTRNGTYGGDFAGRTRLLSRIIDSIRTAAPNLDIGVRVSIADTVPFESDPESRVGRPMPDGHADQHAFGVAADDPTGFDLEAGFELLRLLQSLRIELVNLTLGSPYYNPHLQRPAAYPPSDGYLPPVDPLASVLQHLRVARSCKAAFPGLRFVGTGYTYLQEYLPHVAEHEVAHGHVDFVGLGRMLLIYPELPHDVLAGRPLQRKRICRTFSDCTTAPRNDMISGCFPLDPYYQAMPEAAQLKTLKKELKKELPK